MGPWTHQISHRCFFSTPLPRNKFADSDEFQPGKYLLRSMEGSSLVPLDDAQESVITYYLVDGRYWHQWDFLLSRLKSSICWHEPHSGDTWRMNWESRSGATTMSHKNMTFCKDQLAASVAMRDCQARCCCLESYGLVARSSLSLVQFSSVLLLFSSFPKRMIAIQWKNSLEGVVKRVAVVFQSITHLHLV